MFNPNNNLQQNTNQLNTILNNMGIATPATTTPSPINIYQTPNNQQANELQAYQNEYLKTEEGKQLFTAYETGLAKFINTKKNPAQAETEKDMKAMREQMKEMSDQLKAGDAKMNALITALTTPNPNTQNTSNTKSKKDGDQ